MQNVKIMVLLKYLSNFLGTLEMPLNTFEINLDLNMYENLFIVVNNTNQPTTFSITDTKLHVSVVTLSSPNNAKLLGQLESDFKRTIN